MIFSSFHNFLDSFEADALRECVTGCDDGMFQRVVIPLLSRFQCNSIPDQHDVQAHLPEVARFALLVKPYFALSEISRGMQEAHPSLWGHCNNPTLLSSLYEMLLPTHERVLAMVTEPEFHNMGQQRVFDYLRRCIQTLSTNELGRFLRFTTGYSVCGPVHISITFNSAQGFQRRPTTNTCTPSLTVSVTYSSFNDFYSKFQCLRRSSHLWFFDSI